MSEYLQKPEDVGFVSDRLSKAYEVMGSAVREGTLLGGSIQIRSSWLHRSRNRSLRAPS